MIQNMITPRKFYDRVLNEICDRLMKEISPAYTYHSLRHTLDVVEMTIEIGKAEKIDDQHLDILKIAALFHDTGYFTTRKNHEEESVNIFIGYANEHGLSEEAVKIITGCILATKIPQNPQNLFEMVVCDADLDYLGREDFIEIGETLYTELTNCGELTDRDAWNHLQYNFLSNLRFHTHYSQTRRQPQLEQNLLTIKRLISI
ncbi:MAG: HD domain-containing protein [Flavobacteriales bacterium]|jgi:uncharacterized protein